MIASLPLQRLNQYSSFVVVNLLSCRYIAVVKLVFYLFVKTGAKSMHPKSGLMTLKHDDKCFSLV